MRSIIKFIKVIFYALLTILGIVFAVGNREKISVSLFPLPYEISIPLFIFTIIIFIMGILTGWFLTRLKVSKTLYNNKKDKAKIGALENEVAAIKSEQLSITNNGRT
jgi:lipopolysaccharide assembly protein A